MKNPLDPLICYCGRPTKIYDSLFKRAFCSDECSTALRLFLGGTDKVSDIRKSIEAGDFRISGTVVTLHETLQAHQLKKAASIDKIDAQIQAGLDNEKDRKELRKLGLDDKTIEAMLLAKKGA